MQLYGKESMYLFSDCSSVAMQEKPKEKTKDLWFTSQPRQTFVCNIACVFTRILILCKCSLRVDINNATF